MFDGQNCRGLTQQYFMGDKHFQGRSQTPRFGQNTVKLDDFDAEGVTINFEYFFENLGNIF